jgi:hypothetical protein
MAKAETALPEDDVHSPKGQSHWGFQRKTWFPFLPLSMMIKWRFVRHISADKLRFLNDRSCIFFSVVYIGVPTLYQ